jgi:hypothetical protein
VLSLLLIALAQCGPEGPIYSCPSRMGPRPFSLFTEYTCGAPRLPQVGDANLVALCRVASNGTSWECVNGQTGASFGTVTQGSGTTYQDTPFGAKALSDITSAKAPKVVSTVLDALWKGDHTVVLAGYSTTATDATYQHWFGAADATNSIYARQEGGTVRVGWGGAGGAVTALNGMVSGTDGWTVLSFRRSGNNHYGRMNGTDSVVESASTITGDFTGGTEFYFGERQAAGHAYPLRGPLGFAAFYGAALTSAQLAAIERGWWGVDSRVSASLATGVSCLDPDGGSIDCYRQGGAMVAAGRGLRAVRATTPTNKWAADALAAATWTDVATPTVTSNASSGPFHRWKQTAECDLIVDNDAAAFEGKRGADGYIVSNGAQSYTASCYLAAGTSGTTTTAARLQLDVTGGGWGDAGTTHACDITGLTSTVTRQTCTSPAFIIDAGSPTVRGALLVGNTAATTGSVTACQCQLTPAAYVAEPAFDNASRSNSSQTIDPVADGWPDVTSGGKYEVVFTPVYDPLSQWRIGDDIIYLFDANDGTDHSAVVVLGYQLAGRTLVRTQNGGDWTEIITPDITLASGIMRAVAIEWRREGGGTYSVSWRFDACPDGNVATCRAQTLQGTETGGFGPSQPTSVELGNRVGGAFPTDVFISAVRVYQ